jgi:hypothetical protein
VFEQLLSIGCGANIVVVEVEWHLSQSARHLLDFVVAEELSLHFVAQ